MNVLAPRDAAAEEWRSLVTSIAAQRPLAPFDDVLVDFVDAVSKAIASDPPLRAVPDAVALAHWMRRAHLLEMKRDFERLRGATVTAARGLAVHFAPANVDEIFVYSWFLALLAGNCNVVRLSSERNATLDGLVRILGDVMLEPRFEAIHARNAIVSYPHDEEVTGFISRRCHVRVLWGGDETIRAIRRVPLAPLAIELPFADRFSMAAFSASAVLQCADEELKKLAHRFCNDAFAFDQLACSSPRLVLWVGSDREIAASQARFWPAVRARAERRSREYPDVVGIDRATAMFAYAASGQLAARSSAMTEFPGRVELAATARDFRSMHCGAGLFLERGIGELAQALPLLTEKDQTLVHFGFTEAELRAFALQLPPRALDRIVPVGRALEFSPVWDGIDLLQAFTRIVDIQA
jgi:hypothetical protein